jgi:hypothetical protein
MNARASLGMLSVYMRQREQGKRAYCTCSVLALCLLSVYLHLWPSLQWASLHMRLSSYVPLPSCALTRSCPPRRYVLKRRCADCACALVQRVGLACQMLPPIPSVSSAVDAVRLPLITSSLSFYLIQVTLPTVCHVTCPYVTLPALVSRYLPLCHVTCPYVTLSTRASFRLFIPGLSPDPPSRICLCTPGSLHVQALVHEPVWTRQEPVTQQQGTGHEPVWTRQYRARSLRARRRP